MTKPKDFKFIQGAYCTGTPADICYYTDVDYWSVQDFIWELDYLVDYIKPSKIRVHVNSVGGSVIEGMSVFAKLMDCPIPTECINDGLAASMGSIIWAAGNELYMKDYALIMIHNPFCESNGAKEYNQATEAFTQQLKTIYVKRFGLPEDEVEDIMNGRDGDDGTFLTASQAIEKGLIKADHIIETPKAVKDQIQAALNGTQDMVKIKAVYGLVTPTASFATIKEQKHISNYLTMDKELTVVAALLGLTGEKANAENVSATITELKVKAGKSDTLQKALDESKAELTKVNAELTGAKTSMKNLQADLDKANASLKAYHEAEARAREEKVNALIEKAINECKINKDEREDYLKMAQSDFALAERVLAKIPARDNIGNIISKMNQEEANKGMKTEEERIKAKVEEIVGSNFQFRSMK